MIPLNTWLDIRTRHREGESIKEIVRATGSSKNTVRKYLKSDAPPRQSPPTNRDSSMARFQIQVDQLLLESPTIRSSRIVTILRERIDPTFRIGERAARRYVASRRSIARPKEAFIRLVYAPGDQMQFDFKDIVATIAGIRTELHLFVARLSYSTKWFAWCYRTEDRPALFDGLLRACVSFGGVAREGLFDNASTAVDRVLRGRHRVVNTEFAEFCGSLTLSVQFAAPAKGNEKGGVEGLHGFIEDNVFTPMLDVTTLDEINDALAVFSHDDDKRIVAGEAVGVRFEREVSALRPLPAVLPSPCLREYARVNKFAEVTHKTNRYSVPTAYAHRDAVIECYADRLKIIVDAEVVAEHLRSFGKHESILDPLHFIDLLSIKHRAVEHAAVFLQERFPRPLKELLQHYVDDDRLNAGKRFMRVMSLLKSYPIGQIADTVELARLRGTDDPEAIALLLDQASRPQHAFVPLPIAHAVIGSARPNADLGAYATSLLKECAA